MTAQFIDVADVGTRLGDAGYLSNVAIDTVVYVAGKLGKPILVEGPAGVGKTELAKAIAHSLDAALVRLQCYEGLDEAKALYEWNYARQLLRITHARTSPAGDGTAIASSTADRDARQWAQVETELFSEDYLLERPLLRALRSAAEQPTVLLVDEIDKVDFEFEALLLEILSDFQVTIPELGTVVAQRRPWVVLTSNATRELSEALKRRCLFLHLDYPTIEREQQILRAQVPHLDDLIIERIARLVRSLRDLNLRKPPSIAESIDWAQTIVALAVADIDNDVIASTLGVLLKHDEDIVTVVDRLGLTLP